MRLKHICPVGGSKHDDRGKYNSRTKKWHTLDTAYDTILDVYTLDTSESQNRTHDSISGIWICRFYSQIPYNYKLL